MICVGFQGFECSRDRNSWVQKIDQWTKFPRRQNTSFECRIIRMKRWETRVRNMGKSRRLCALKKSKAIWYRNSTNKREVHQNWTSRIRTPLQIIFQIIDCRNVNITFSHVKWSSVYSVKVKQKETHQSPQSSCFSYANIPWTHKNVLLPIPMEQLWPKTLFLLVTPTLSNKVARNKSNRSTLLQPNIAAST